MRLPARLQTRHQSALDRVELPPRVHQFPRVRGAQSERLPREDARQAVGRQDDGQPGAVAVRGGQVGAGQPPQGAVLAQRKAGAHRALAVNEEREREAQVGAVGKRGRRSEGR